MKGTPRTGLLAAYAVLWAAEIHLARRSSVPVTLEDMGLSFAFFVAWALLVLGLARLLGGPRSEPGRLARGLLMLVAGLPLVIVAQGILSPIHLAYKGVAVTLFGFVPVTIGLLTCLLSLPFRGAPFPNPLLVGLMVAACPFPVWIWEGFPKGSTLLAFLAGTALVAALGATRLWPILLGLGVLLGGWPLPHPVKAWSQPPGQAVGPDILLISVDTLRSDAAQGMESYRRLAREGIAFPMAQGASPWTLPSVASLLTGLPYMDHGANRMPQGGFSVIDEPVVSIAEALRGSGWDTAAVLASNPYLRAQFGFARGFDVFDHLSEFSPHPVPRGRSIARPSVPRALARKGLHFERASGAAEVVVDRAIRILEARRERSLFLWVHFLDCHLPYRHARSAPLPRDRRILYSGLTRRDLLMGRGGVEIEEVRTVYRHEVEIVDREILRLLDALGPVPPQGRIVAFTADHGEEFLDHDAWEHGHSVFQELLAVPLVIAGTGFDPESVSIPPGAVAAQIDLAPTLLAAAGAPRIGKGVDLRTDLGSSRAVVSGGLLYNTGGALVSVVKGPWKAIFSKEDPTRLYDLSSDPGETELVEDPDIIRSLEEHLAFKPVYGKKSLMDKGTEDALRALGYVE